MRRVLDSDNLSQPYGGSDRGICRGNLNPETKQHPINDLESHLQKGDLVALKTTDNFIYCLHYFGIHANWAEFGLGIPYRSSHYSYSYFVDITTGKFHNSVKIAESYEIIKPIQDFSVPYKTSH